MAKAVDFVADVMKEVIEMEVVELIEFYIATLLCHLVVLQLQIMVVGSGVAWC